MAGELAGACAQVPLARHVGVIPDSLQQGGHGHYITTEHALVVRVALLLRCKHLRNIGHTSKVRVNAGEQHGPGWRTVGRRVVVGKAHALPCQRIDSGRANFTAVGGEIGKAEVIGQYQYDIGPLNRCCIGVFYKGC